MSGQSAGGVGAVDREWSGQSFVGGSGVGLGRIVRVSRFGGAQPVRGRPDGAHESGTGSWASRDDSHCTMSVAPVSMTPPCPV
jgi:hypothetical protein